MPLVQQNVKLIKELKRKQNPNSNTQPKRKSENVLFERKKNYILR